MANNFEKFLTHEAYKKYSLKYLSHRWLKTEIDATGPIFSEQLGRDMVHFENLRQDITNSLSQDPAEQGTAAHKWSTYLKPRIEGLELWATMITAFGAFMAAGTIILSLAWPNKGPVDYFFVFAGAITAFFVAAKRLEIDRRKSWYKYLVSHLDAIKAPRH